MPGPSQEDLNKNFSKSHKIIRKKRAFKKVEQLSGINIEHQSQINILALYARLREGTGLSPAYHDAISCDSDFDSDVEDFSGLRIDNSRYQNFPRPVAGDYQSTIQLLIEAGANVKYSTGRGVSFLSLHRMERHSN